jgi:hypothetical protein
MISKFNQLNMHGTFSGEPNTSIRAIESSAIVMLLGLSMWTKMTSAQSGAAKMWYGTHFGLRTFVEGQRSRSRAVTSGDVGPCLAKEYVNCAFHLQIALLERHSGL